MIVVMRDLPSFLQEGMETKHPPSEEEILASLYLKVYSCKGLFSGPCLPLREVLGGNFMMHNQLTP